MNDVNILKPKPAIMKEVMAAVCHVVGTTKEECLNPDRSKRIGDARKIFCYVLREFPNNHFTLMEIGAELNRDHSTVLHLLKAAKDHYEMEGAFKEQVERVRARIRPYIMNNVNEKTEILDCITSRISQLKIWLKDHPGSSYRTKILEDLRDLENELQSAEQVIIN